MSENRIIEIETKLAFQEKTIEDLNQTVVQLNKKLHNLEQICQLLTTRLKDVHDQIGPQSDDHHQPPPHY